jgi:hypothetical protein
MPSGGTIGGETYLSLPVSAHIPRLEDRRQLSSTIQSDASKDGGYQTSAHLLTTAHPALRKQREGRPLFPGTFGLRRRVLARLCLYSAAQILSAMQRRWLLSGLFSNFPLRTYLNPIFPKTRDTCHAAEYQETYVCSEFSAYFAGFPLLLRRREFYITLTQNTHYIQESHRRRVQQTRKTSAQAKHTSDWLNSVTPKCCYRPVGISP